MDADTEVSERCARIVCEFLDTWHSNPKDLLAGFEANFAPDCVWEQTGMPTTNSSQEALELTRRGMELMGVDSVRVDIRAIAARGNVVFTERVDHLLDEAGDALLSVQVAGVFEINGEGRIAAWREYFDPRTGLEKMDAPS